MNQTLEQTVESTTMPEKYEMVTCIKAIGAVKVGNSAEVSSVENHQVNLYGKGCGRYEHVPSDVFWQHFMSQKHHTTPKPITKSQSGTLT